MSDAAHPQGTIPIAVLARSYPPATKWGERVLDPSALMLPAPPLAPRSRLSTSQTGVETWFIATVPLVLHPGDADNLRSNLAMAPPRLWVSLSDADRPDRVEVRMITADPFEGEAMATDPALRVAALPMPEALIEHVTAFAALFPEGEKFRKKKRMGIEAEDPGLLAPRILPGGYSPGPRARPRREGSGQ